MPVPDHRASKLLPPQFNAVLGILELENEHDEEKGRNKNRSEDELIGENFLDEIDASVSRDGLGKKLVIPQKCHRSVDCNGEGGGAKCAFRVVPATALLFFVRGESFSDVLREQITDAPKDR